MARFTDVTETIFGGKTLTLQILFKAEWVGPPTISRFVKSLGATREVEDTVSPYCLGCPNPPLSLFVFFTRVDRTTIV